MVKTLTIDKNKKDTSDSKDSNDFKNGDPALVGKESSVKPVDKMIDKKITMKDLKASDPRWCTGCGDYTILVGMRKFMVDNQLLPENTVHVSGIGCSGRVPHYLNTYGFHSIHGRAPAIATGLAERYACWGATMCSTRRPSRALYSHAKLIWEASARCRGCIQICSILFTAWLG